MLVEKPSKEKKTRDGVVWWEDSVKMDLGVMGCKGVDWIKLAQDRANGYDL
jgi:hypothetical protein